MLNDLSILNHFRMGMGHDTHRLAEGLPLVLGGVLIETSPKGAVAHSDGDVVWHALVDALLGATALGDIGDHFPPDDATWHKAEGVALWRLACQAVQQQRGAFTLLNVDVTIHLEAPKLKGYKLKIREQLSKDLALAKNNICVKAKTAEGLDAVGQGEAIVASVGLLLALKEA
jgi:2-C-methyl-D-erythritol 2,4-cyclodiphosphate synthase